MIIILLSIFFSNIYAARGDLISAQFLGTKSIANNQTYVDNEIGSLTGQFSLDPVEYGYWMYKITYETIDVNGDVMSYDVDLLEPFFTYNSSSDFYDYCGESIQITDSTHSYIDYSGDTEYQWRVSAYNNSRMKYTNEIRKKYSVFLI